jgi:hypothetical protein
VNRYLHEWCIAVAAVLLSVGRTAGFTELAGELPQEIRADKSPYLVRADIFVTTGKTVRIEPGTVFLFNNFTGLHVQGVLTVKGTAARPVIFSSAHDRALQPTPSTPLRTTGTESIFRRTGWVP